MNRVLLAFIAAMSSFAIMISCVKDPFIESGDKEFIILAESAGITKTQIGQTQPGGYLEISWLPSDQIGVFSTEGSCYKFDNTLKSAAEHGVFKGTLPAGKQPQYAFYPYSSGASDLKKVPVDISSEQQYDGPSSIAPNDIKASNDPISTSDGVRFNFKTLSTMLRISLDKGSYSSTFPQETLSSITLEDATSRALCGNFKLNLQNLTLSAGTSTTSSVKLVTGTSPKLSDGKTTAYALVNPDVKKDDRLKVTIETSIHKFTFTMKVTKDFLPGTCYDIPIDLGKASESSTFKAETIVNLPKFTSFRFDASLNQGAILSKEVYYDSSDNTTKVKNSEGSALQIGEDGNVSGCIPYLYKFTLVPSFTLSDTDKRYVVKVGDAVQTSGVSSQDFSNDVTYTVYDTETSLSADYTVSVTNTGLPVIVLTQNTSGSFYYESWNYYLDRYLVGKTSDFGTDDRIAVYEGKGVVSLEEMDCGFRQRGNFSMRFPKKAVNIKLSEKKKILGLSKNKRWCLMANWNDRTLLRNALSFEVARRIAATSSEGTGLDWQPTGKFVELVLNGMHVGTYYIVEQIRQDKNRVNISDDYMDRKDDYDSGKSTIAPAYDNCGYLLEIDNNSTDSPSAYGAEEWYFRTNYCYERKNSHIPVVSHNDYDQTSVGSSIWSQLKSYVNNADYYIYNGNYTQASNYVDMTSAADFMLVMEIAMNHEYMHPKSVYLHKDGAGKLFFGPMWDFDVWTYPSIPNISKMGRQNEAYPNSYDKWTFTTESTSSHYYFWYKHLLKQSAFVSLVKERWSAISAASSLTPESIASYIDSLKEQIKLSMEYNDKMWPRTYSSPCSGYQNGDEWNSDSKHTAFTFEESVQMLKSAYKSRYDKMGSLVSNLTTSTYPTK